MRRRHINTMLPKHHTSTVQFIAADNSIRVLQYKLKLRMYILVGNTTASDICNNQTSLVLFGAISSARSE